MSIERAKIVSVGPVHLNDLMTIEEYLGVATEEMSKERKEEILPRLLQKLCDKEILNVKDLLMVLGESSDSLVRFVN